MNNTFCCLVCDKQTHLFVLDRRNDHFYCCLCTNNRCTVSHFVACRLCEYNNTGICDYWYHAHLKQKKQKQQVRNLKTTFRNIDIDHSPPSNDCNEAPNPNIDNNEVQRNNDSSNTFIINGNNQDTLCEYIFFKPAFAHVWQPTEHTAHSHSYNNSTGRQQQQYSSKATHTATAATTTIAKKLTQ